MAMNKKEKQAYDNAILQAETIAALRWTAAVGCDLRKPNIDEIIFGFDFNVSLLRVNDFYSKFTSHGRGNKNERISGTASQGGRELFSTELLALKALRHAVELESAKKLLTVDKMIANLANNQMEIRQ